MKRGEKNEERRKKIRLVCGSLLICQAEKKNALEEEEEEKSQ